jgi:hypothetical protein
LKFDEPEPGFLLGYYPGNRDPEITRKQIRDLLDSGFRCFVDLTQKGELIAYDQILAQEANTLGVQVVYRRCPIPKGYVPHDPLVVAQALSIIEEGFAVGSNMYIHGAREGIGRCLIVAACWFQDHGLSPEDSLMRAGFEAKRTWKPEEPEIRQLCSPEQVRWIERWPELWVMARSGHQIDQMLAHFDDQLRSLNVEYKKLRRQNRRDGEIDLVTTQDLPGRLATLQKDVYSIFDAYCYLARIPRTVPRAESYRNLSTVLGYVPNRLLRVTEGFDKLAAAGKQRTTTSVRKQIGGTSRKMQLEVDWGYYPGYSDPEVTRTAVRRNLDSGYRYFVDLTQKGELTPYDRILAEEANVLGLEIVYKRFPIPKGSVPSNPLIVAQALSAIEEGGATGRKVLVHGGRDETGRVTVVVACLLQDEGLSSQQAVMEATKVSEQMTWESMLPKSVCSQEQLIWIQGWLTSRAETTSKPETWPVLCSFEDRLNAIKRDLRRLRRQNRRNGKIDPAAVDSLSRRLGALKREAYLTLDAYCRFTGIPLTVPRTESYRQLDVALEYRKFVAKIIGRFDELETELTAISADSQQLETTISAKMPQSKLMDLAISVGRTAAKRARAVARRSG